MEKKEVRQASRKMVEVRKELNDFSVELDVRASVEGREGVPANQLLREAYGIKQGAELHTFDGWKRRGGTVRKGEKAFLFWGKPRMYDSRRFFPVVFLFSASQVHFSKEVAL